MTAVADPIQFNGKFTTLDRSVPTAVAGGD